MPDAARLSFALFPPGDRLFADFVGACWNRLIAGGNATPEALQQALRAYHTRAVVRPREALAGFGASELWYVYRDGRASGAASDRWWEQPGAARLRFDDSGAVTWADDDACALAGLPPGELVGRHPLDLVPPEGRESMSAVAWEHLAREGVMDSVFDCVLPDGSLRVIEYHAERSRTGHEHQGAWRELALIPGAVPAEG